MDDRFLVDLIAEAVRGYCLSMNKEAEAVGPETLLYGTEGVLDSIGLVAVIVELEQKLSDQEGREISLMDERAVSQTSSPFRSVRTLAEYARTRMPEGNVRPSQPDPLSK
jgi:acyl carrier protein